jgi:hypothetical protein
VPEKGKFDLPWIIDPGDRTENELEIWYPGNTRLGVEILTPDGATLQVPPGKEGTFHKGDEIVLFVANRLGDPNNGDNMINIYLNPTDPGGGRWIVRLQGDPDQAVDFHAWVERDDRGQSHFPESLDNSHTIGSISCGHDSIVVGSYDAHKPLLPLSWFSSAGPTRDGRQKPEVSAPGHDVLAAASRSKNGTTRKSGTSMAAPAVTGAIALMLAEAKKRGKSLSIDQIRQALLTTVRHDPPPAQGFDLRFGNGRVSAKGLVQSIV